MNARDEIDEILDRSPSLKSYLEEAPRMAYPRARRTAGAQMGWTEDQWERRLPHKCPWTIEQIRTDFWPDD
ncbi:MAG TPA: DUF29 family protein, partial [Candidatus Binataceae bacterium]|nr:DUF29 family protein [Candidatus Binataceae bacterium]